MTRWTSANIPSQTGRTAVVTGTGGLGFQDALALARTGASVVVAGRNAQKGAEAVARIKALVPPARVRFGELDLASLASVAGFAGRLLQEQDSLDLLINNAGVMTPPDRRLTHDGFELQFGTNYLGHFALTAHLLPLLRKGQSPRVVTLGSIAARQGIIDLENLQSARGYNAMAAYSQSKLACISFGLELSRRSRAAGWDIASMVAHPGVSRTDLLPNGAGGWSGPGMARRFLPFLFQPAAHGAWTTLYAATSPDAVSGTYYGPSRMGGTRGYPKVETPPAPVLDTRAAARLWEDSLALTGVRFD